MQLARKFLDVAGKFNFVEFILSLKNKSDELLRVWHNLFWEFLLFLFCWYSSSVLFCLVVLCRRPNGPLQLALLFVCFYIIQLFLSFFPPYSLAILMLSVEYHKTILKYTGYEAFFLLYFLGVNWAIYSTPNVTGMFYPTVSKTISKSGSDPQLCLWPCFVAWPDLRLKCNNVQNVSIVIRIQDWYL